MSVYSFRQSMCRAVHCIVARAVVLSLLVGAFLSVVGRVVAAAGADFYVAPAGDDAWSGRLPKTNADRTDGPFATLERARDAIRQFRATNELARPVVVQAETAKGSPGRRERTPAASSVTMRASPTEAPWIQRPPAGASGSARARRSAHSARESALREAQAAQSSTPTRAGKSAVL